ncbi:MAG: ABC transporter permease [Bacteroidota bacterium]
MENIILAWRNLWRNKPRTFIILAAVFLGVLLSSLMTSMQEGMYGSMIDNIVKFSSGYIQVQDSAYWEKKTINNLMYTSDSLKNKINNIDRVTKVVPRLQSGSLISSGEKTTFGAVVGIDPGAELNLSNPKKWLEKGEYLQPNDDGVLVSYNVAKKIDVKVGDTLILLSQGYHGASAAGLYPVRGIIKFSSPQANNLGVFMDIGQAQFFFSAQDMVTSLVVMVEDYKDVQDVQRNLENEIDDHFNVMTWKEMYPEIVQAIQGDRASGGVFKFVLYLVIGFGILSTVIMMVNERKREMAVMVAVGMKNIKLAGILIMETFLIGLLGMLAGFSLSVPVAAFFTNNPIPLPRETAEIYEQFGMEAMVYFSIEPMAFLKQAIIVFVISLLVGIYPFISALRLNVIKTLHA